MHLNSLIQIADRRYAAFRTALICSISDDVAKYYEDALLLITVEEADAGRIFDLGSAAEIAASYGLDLDEIEKSKSEYTYTQAIQVLTQEAVTVTSLWIHSSLQRSFIVRTALKAGNNLE